MDEKTFLDLCLKRENELIGEIMCEPSTIVKDGMLYALGGKMVRERAVYLGAKAVNPEIDVLPLVDVACAIQYIHSYSLVHDDLPCMDNDDYRRGKLSAHKAFGEGNGVLIGDALLTAAANSLLGAIAKDDRLIKSAQAVMKGAQDMVRGQALDLVGVQSKENYLEIVSLKTCAMIKASFMAGAYFATADEEKLENIENYATAIGMAFQIADDLLDEEKEKAIFGTVGKANLKEMLATYSENAIMSAKELCNKDVLEKFALMLRDRQN